MREALRDLRRGVAAGRPLGQELAGLWRIRVGALRVIYREVGQAIEIVTVGPRRTIYMELEREARAERGS